MNTFGATTVVNSYRLRNSSTITTSVRVTTGYVVVSTARWVCNGGVFKWRPVWDMVDIARVERCPELPRRDATSLVRGSVR